MKRDTIREMVRGAYDLQELRIASGNRLVADFRSRAGQGPGKKSDTLDKEAVEIIDVLRGSYGRLTDGVADNIRSLRARNFRGDKVISDYAVFCLVKEYLNLERSEKEHFADVGEVLMECPVYSKWMKDVKGVGPQMAGVIISEVDITKATYPSSIWKYAGLDVGPDGRGRGRYAEHLVDVDYVDKDGNDATRKSITFNPFLKTKLVGVLASSFLRVGPNPYREIYHNYKARLEASPKHQEKSKGHRHSMAKRYMIKRFLVDLYVAWRELEELPVAQEYSVAKLGMEHGAA